MKPVDRIKYRIVRWRLRRLYAAHQLDIHADPKIEKKWYRLSQKKIELEWVNRIGFSDVRQPWHFAKCKQGKAPRRQRPRWPMAVVKGEDNTRGR